MNAIKFDGLTLTGTYMGTRVQNSKPDANGQTKQTLYCGIGFFTNGAYGQKETIIEAIISKGLIDKGLPVKLAALEGKQVTLPVFCTPWTNGKGMNTFVANDAMQLFEQQQVKAAS